MQTLQVFQRQAVLNPVLNPEASKLDSSFTFLTLVKACLWLIPMLIAGCATTPDWIESAGSTHESRNTISIQSETMAEPGKPVAKARIFPGKQVFPSGQPSSSGGSSADDAPGGGDIILNFSDLPVRDAAALIIGDYMNASYRVAADVQGNVSLNNRRGLSRDDLIPTLSVLLAGINAQVVNTGDGYEIVSGSSGIDAPGQQSLEILPLRHIDAFEFGKLLSGYQVAATPIRQGNLLALNGQSSSIAKVRELAKSFDISWLSGMSVGMFPVQNADVEVLRKELLTLVGQDADQQVSTSLRIMAVERANSILAIAPHQKTIELVGQWTKRLDTVGGSDASPFYVYRVQNGKASELAKLLAEVLGLASDTGRDSGQALGANTSPGPSKSQTRKVIADDSSNSIIIAGSPRDYKVVREAMAELDGVPLQVLVEARIVELTLKDELEYGLEWFLNGSRASSNTSATLDFGNTGITALQPGFGYLVERAGEVRAALNGLADDSRLKVLSSPSLMVLNNRAASILVGDEVPIPTRQAVSNISPDAPTVNEIEYRNTGILLTVTPRVNSSGMVTMDISQEVSSVVNNTSSQIDAPTIQQRQLNSTVSIRSGQTVVLGGLIREQQSDRDAGVPLLKDLPALGKLFSNVENVSQRTELVVLITPRVVTNQADTDAITNEFKQKMIGLRPITLDQL
ncbi:MAG: type II secretion system secretin GspD [Pseudomonadota bacterium]